MIFNEREQARGHAVERVDHAAQAASLEAAHRQRFETIALLRQNAIFDSLCSAHK